MPIASEWKQQWPGLQWSARTCAPFEWGLAAWRRLLGHPVAWRCKWWHLTCLGDAAITFPLTSLWGQQIQVACLEATEQSKAWLWLLSRGVLLIFSKVFCNNFLGVFFCISWFPITISRVPYCFHCLCPSRHSLTAPTSALRCLHWSPGESGGLPSEVGG